jgi:hypothetical protein
MSIKTTYNLYNVQIPDVIIRIDRLWGSSKEGWTALVGVYTTEIVPAVAAVGTEGKAGYIPAKPETTSMNKITEFNHSVAYVDNESAYISLYKSLQDKFGGVDV